MPQQILVRSILNKTRRRDPWFLDDYTINPYSGCTFNCQYCYIRGSKFGTHMEERTSVKGNAAELLEKQLHLRAKKNQFGIIVLSSATDPYLHFEKEEKLTRQLLEIILRYRFPVHIITKSDLVIRDFDILEQINRQAVLPADLDGRLLGRAFISFSFSTIDDSIASIFEPGATPPSQRLVALKSALQHFQSGVNLMPLLPFITDTGNSLMGMFECFSALKVSYIFPTSLTLFGNGPADSKALVLRSVGQHYPHLLEKYRSWFLSGNEMPASYSKALHQKTLELSSRFGLKNSLF